MISPPPSRWCCCRHCHIARLKTCVQSLVLSLEYGRIFNIRFFWSADLHKTQEKSMTRHSMGRRSPATGLSRLVLKVQVPGCPHIFSQFSQWLLLFRNAIRPLKTHNILCNGFVIEKNFMKQGRDDPIQKWSTPHSTWDGQSIFGPFCFNSSGTSHKFEMKVGSRLKGRKPIVGSGPHECVGH